MPKTAKSRPIRFIILFYLLCFVLRAIEYLLIRTDQSVIGEAFIHKLAGIALLALALRAIPYRWGDIGFSAGRKAAKGLSWGLLLGLGAYIIAYGAEMLLQAPATPSLHFYAASYALEGGQAMQGGIEFIMIVILGNIINVIMEEGVFRGLFQRLGEEKYSFAKALIFSAILFGLWHIALPVRNVIDGVQSAPGAAMAALMLVGTSAIGGVQYALLYKMTGTLYTPMAAHFVNNAIVNLLHVHTVSGVDAMQTLRITIAQTVASVVVLVVFIVWWRKKKGKGSL